MKIQNMIATILQNSRDLGVFSFSDLFAVASSQNLNGIAVSKEDEQEYYLAFVNGEPEGAIFIDEKGTLYGDNAVMLITGRERVHLYEVSPDIVQAVVMGCRIFEKTRLKTSMGSSIPEFGKKSSGLGVLNLTLLHDGVPVNGVRVSIRREGKIVGSDITTQDGTVGFRVLFGEYECIVQDRNSAITTVPVKFTESDHGVNLTI